MKKLFIALAGNIGAGKTTAAKLVSQRFGFELFDEPVIDNRFLRDYYANMHPPYEVHYLHSNATDVLLRRMRERGRKEEAGITPAFLDGLAAYYRTFPQVAKGKYKLDVLTPDVARLDIRTPQGKEEFLD